jgi:hypothetical protein
LRPEQEQLFKNVIPPKFWEESDKYHSLLDKIETEFTERRMKNLEKRQLRKNIHKKDNDLNKGDFCVIKKFSEIIGTSRKLRETFEFLPFKILYVKEFYSVLENLIDGSHTLRSNNDIKRIELFNNEQTSDFLLEKLNILTADNIITLFNSKRNEENTKQIKTRSTSKLKVREQEEIFNNYLLDDDIFEIDEPKSVRFDI